jgi:hypothetical protein
MAAGPKPESRGGFNNNASAEFGNNRLRNHHSNNHTGRIGPACSSSSEPGFFVPALKRKETHRMAVKLIANYAKRLGLPGYSSHQFSISVETELTDLGAVEAESTRLYHLLQESVDAEIRETGFVPDPAYGLENGNGGNGTTSNHTNNGNGARGNGGKNGHSNADVWRCSDKQREFILRLVDEKHLDKNEVENTSQQLFGVGVRQLNKLQASGLIEELLERHGGSNGNGSGNGGRQTRRHFRGQARRAGAAE